MKGTYEKILFAIAALVFGAGLAWFFLFAGEPREGPSLSTLPIGDDYEPRERPRVETAEATWTEARPQSEDGLWLYDLFTPPKIYINPATELFSVVPYVEDKTGDTFGVVLAGMERRLYRLQYEGYVEDNPGDASQSLIRIYARDLDRALLVRVGQAHPEGRFRVVDFEVDPSLSPGGMIERSARLTLFDEQTGETVTLDSQGPRYSDRAVVLLRAEDGSEAAFRLSGRGESFEWRGFVYRLMDLNPEQGSVRVERTEESTGESEVEVLRVAPPASSASLAGPREDREAYLISHYTGCSLQTVIG